MRLKITIALAGNPNSGKTTLFNELTGSSQYVGNWPGVTVEKKEGKLKNHKKDVYIMDLPGIYSLSPYTLEEVVSRDYLVNEKPDVIINIVDATNLERNLYLTTQLKELGIPVVVALNMMDLVEKNGDKIDTNALSKKIGAKVVEISALKSNGIDELIDVAVNQASLKSNKDIKMFEKEIENSLVAIEDIIKDDVDESLLRWYAIKLFEDDKKAIVLDNKEKNEKVKSIVDNLCKKYDDDGESIITNARYEYIEGLIGDIYKKEKREELSVSDKIDRIVTNRFLALPIFALVMYAVYYISVTTIGSIGTDWVNDVLFGDIIPPAVESFLVSINCAGWLQSLILDGIIGGVGSVLGFLPQMVVLFFLLAILEDIGYMARVAFIMDRIFRKFGLSGKSFIPMLIGTGCGVPAIMASRTIENERDRKMTIMTTTFIPCSAKLPIIALIAGAFFSDASWVAPSAYFIGVIAIVLSGIVLKKTRGFSGDPAPFVMELPSYHIPSIKNVFIHMWDRSKSFVKKAGTIIFLSCVAIWFLSNFNFSFKMVDTGESMLATLGKLIAPVFAPLGFGHWEAAVASITGLVAKENVLSTFGVLYGVGEMASENGAEIFSNMAMQFTALSAYSFLVFNLLCAPCFAAIGAIKREMGNAKWTWIAIGYQTGFAYFVSLCIYQFGLLFTDGGIGILTIIAGALLIWFLYLLLRPQLDEKELETAQGMV